MFLLCDASEEALRLVFPLDGITMERNNTSGTQEVASAEIPESVGLRMTHLTLLS